VEKTKIKIIEYDPYLKPYEKDLTLRMDNYKRIKAKTLGEADSLPDFANGYNYYGFHKTDTGWVYRDWAPGADRMYLIGEFNNWDRYSHPLQNIGNGIFEIQLQGSQSLWHGGQVKVHICTQHEEFERIPPYIRRAVQQQDTSFNGVIWVPDEPFQWTDEAFRRNKSEPLFIYECHVGMSSEQYHISSFNDFTSDVLPRIRDSGYNVVQLMAVMGHSYYGSFGYQVTNFFAVSSWFGTPEDLKNLVNTAHNMGISVFLDLVHSHASPNAMDGLGRYDGTDYQFFHAGSRGNHPAWGSKLFNYGKPEVIHFLLSNIKYWLEEYHFDGLRFDGITSMLYHNNGMDSFTNYSQYFTMNTDTDAVAYLQLAAELSKDVNPDCVLIAEDMSGMPGMCLPISDGGIGFDYRLAMGMPDYWIKTLRDKKDDDWDVGKLWYELTQRRPKEKVIGYCESHDQALVGDKTIIFWLADQELYWHMDKGSQSHLIDRAMALHKMVRLITCACSGEGYLNFMGNEFGHPEWIDFPRESNRWSYHYARRQWSLVDNDNLRYQYLQSFDRAMVSLLKDNAILQYPSDLIVCDESAKALVFTKGDYLFAFNFHPSNRYTYDLSLKRADSYRMLLHTNWDMFGGYEADGSADCIEYSKSKTPALRLRLYNRTAIVLKNGD